MSDGVTVAALAVNESEAQPQELANLLVKLETYCCRTACEFSSLSLYSVGDRSASPTDFSNKLDLSELLTLSNVLYECRAEVKGLQTKESAVEQSTNRNQTNNLEFDIGVVESEGLDKVFFFTVSDRRSYELLAETLNGEKHTLATFSQIFGNAFGAGKIVGGTFDYAELLRIVRGNSEPDDGRGVFCVKGLAKSSIPVHSHEIVVIE